LAKLKRDASKYNRFGLLLDVLCTDRGISFRELARRSGKPWSQSTMNRAATKGYMPSIEMLDSWCAALNCTLQERRSLFHAIGLATPEEKEGQ
jgi:transcriptional regulator with XRE-family HTH domain